MSTLLHPKGSEPSPVYWRRRGLVLVILLLVVLVGWLAWPKGTSSAAPPAAGPAPVSSPPAPPATPATVSSPSAPGSPKPTGPVACETGSSKVDLAGYQKVKQGGKQVFKVSITNTAAPCVLQLSGANFQFTVASGSDRIWATADCDKWVPAVKGVSLKQGQSYQFDLSWGLVRSKAGCTATKDAAKPGTYVGTASFGAEANNARQVFVVTKAG